MADKYKCELCGGPMKLSPETATAVCVACCIEIAVCAFDSKSSFDTYSEVTQDYKRVRTAMEILYCRQGKELVEIPNIIYDALNNELKTYNRPKNRHIKQSFVKQVLAKMKLSKYYKHIPYIHQTWLEIKIDSIPDDMVATLKYWFIRVDAMWPSTHYIVYDFVWYKLIESQISKGDVRFDKYKNLFKLGSDITGVSALSSIWRDICRKICLPFIETT
jgi:hypothetical protein